MAAEMQRKMTRQEAEIERMERELAKIQGKYKSEVTLVERENDQMKKRLEDIEA